MESAIKMSSISLEDLGIAEVYDQSTVLEMAALEDLGFSKQGEAWRHIRKSLESSTGPYELDGNRLFVNTNGGLKADGNPLGATGGAQIFEVVRQLRGEAEEAQISVDGDLSFGCVQEIEGFGTKVYVHILGSELA